MLDLNSDGINYNLFKVFHEEHDRLWCHLDVILPDTIIYFKKKPSSWFLTLKGKVKKKMQHNINHAKIMEVMCRKPLAVRKREKRLRKKGVEIPVTLADKQRIVATYISDKKDRKTGHITTTCQYFDR